MSALKHQWTICGPNGSGNYKPSGLQRQSWVRSNGKMRSRRHAVGKLLSGVIMGSGLSSKYVSIVDLPLPIASIQSVIMTVSIYIESPSNHSLHLMTNDWRKTKFGLSTCWLSSFFLKGILRLFNFLAALDVAFPTPMSFHTFYMLFAILGILRLRNTWALLFYLFSHSPCHLNTVTFKHSHQSPLNLC